MQVLEPIKDERI